MKQTAVEYLEYMFIIQGTIYKSDIEQAKAMEKEQIKNAYRTGDYDVIDNPDREAEQYYNETYLQSHTPKHYRVWFPDVMEAIGGYWWHAVTDPCGRLYDPNHPNEERDTVQWYIDNGYKIEEVTNG